MLPIIGGGGVTQPQSEGFPLNTFREGSGGLSEDPSSLRPVNSDLWEPWRGQTVVVSRSGGLSGAMWEDAEGNDHRRRWHQRRGRSKVPLEP